MRLDYLEASKARARAFCVFMCIFLMMMMMMRTTDDASAR
jgi:hypothetical protein